MAPTATATPVAVKSPFTARTSEVADTLGISQRSIQRYALEGNVDATFDVVTNMWLLHRDYLKRNSQRSKDLLRAFGGN
jgi:hypothetical protein